MATGCLSVPRRPPFEGLERYEGRWYHTGQWPHEEVDFTGMRVGVVGTGSTAIQVIPMVAQQAAHLTVFQRTANFSMPAWNGPLDPDEDRTMKAMYPEYREKARWSEVGVLYESIGKPAAEVEPEQQEHELERQWRAGGFAMLGTFTDVLVDPAANELAAEFCRRKIREKVSDPAVAELLCPKDHPFGTKRLCVDTDYYETFNRENVTLVDIRHTPIEEITPRGLRTGGVEYVFDAIIFATGFDAMTGALLGIDVRGRNGVRLEDEWEAGPPDLSRSRDGRLSQPLRDHRAGIALGAHQHGGLHRAARRMGRRLHRAPEGHVASSASRPRGKPRTSGSIT